MADQEKVLAIAEGRSVIDGVGQFLVNIIGSFIGEKAPFDPAKHKLGVTYTIGKLLRETLDKVKVVTYKATTGPVINDIIDSTTGEMNQQLTSASAAIISGENIRVSGDDAANGVFFTKTGGRAVESNSVDPQQPFATDRPYARNGRWRIYLEYHHPVRTRRQTGKRTPHLYVPHFALCRQ